MDQGVIRSLKAKYRQNIVRRFITSINKDNCLPKISILDGMQMLVSAWNSVPEETIVNCFRKAGISAENQTAVIADDDDPFKELQEEIDTLRTCQPDLIPEGIDANTLVEVDSEIIATQPLPSDNEILAEFMDIDDQDDDIEFIDDNDEELKCPEKSELLHALETLQQFSLFTSDDGYDIQSKCSSLQRTVQKHFVKVKKQKNIRDYFY